jgi:ABC-2 type transport system permease protein
MKESTQLSLQISGILVLLLLSSFIYTRIDFTQDKRYTLGDESNKILTHFSSPIEIDVFLDGDFPSNFKQLQRETEFILDEITLKNKKISYKFINPSKEELIDSLISLGISPTKIQIEEKDVYKEIMIFPFAIAKSKEKRILIPLLVEKIGISPEKQINISIENLEYSFVNNLNILTQKKKKSIGILTHHDELDPLRFASFMQSANTLYNVFPIIPKNQKSLSQEDLEDFNRLDAIVVAKPLYPFSDEDKVVLDQFVMQGGKMLWMIDQVNAEMDSLYVQDKILAYPIDLNLTDLFFSYGVRINSLIVKDLQGSILRLATGNIGGNTQYSNFIWPYSPLTFAQVKSPITKNINPVKFEFAAPIELLNNTKLKQTILLNSSAQTMIKKPMSYISLEELSKPEDPALYNQQNLPLAVLLEGKFNSAYAQRIERKLIKGFKNTIANNKMIVISDGDLGKNQVQEGKPLPLGYDKWINQTYGNGQFLMNCLDYLLNDNGLLTLRNKELKEIMINKMELRNNKIYYHFVNFILPLLFIFLIGFGLYFKRNKAKKSDITI